MHLNLRKRYTKTYLLILVVVGFFCTYFFSIALTQMLTSSYEQTQYLQEAKRSQEDADLAVFNTTILVLAFIFLYLNQVTQSYFLTRRLKRRTKKLLEASQHYGLTLDTTFKSSVLVSPSLADLGDRDVKITNWLQGEDWRYYDYAYSVYKRYKNGDYKAYDIYFSVTEFKLPRELPNVFFDSKHSGKREFKRLFHKDQRHSLEGNFDDHFDTYFEPSYTIDDMSFISPEVMEVLLASSHYDIEIYKDKLILYSELEDMPEQLTDMYEKGKAIRSKLLNNILTYRDDRLDASLGRKTVTVEALQLKRSLFRYFVSIVVPIVTGISSLLIILFVSNNELRGAAVRFFIISVVYAIAGWYGLKRVKMEQLYRIDREKNARSKFTGSMAHDRFDSLSYK